MTNLTSSVFLQVAEVFPTIAPGLAAGGTFQIHDAPHPRIHGRDVQRAAGFKQDGEAGVAERAHQRQGVFLQERLAAGQFDQRQAEGRGMGSERPGQSVDPGQDFRQGYFPALGEGVGGVAIGAAQIAGSQAHEDTGPAGPGAFALQAEINLVDDQSPGHPGSL